MSLPAMTDRGADTPTASVAVDVPALQADEESPDQPSERPGQEAFPQSASRDDESPFGPARIRLTVGAILTVVAVGFQALAVATVLPAVVDDLGGLHLYGWAFSAFLLTQLVGIVVSGLLADERGPALPFALGVLLFAGGLLVGGLAPSMPVLIAGRALQGFGGGAIISTAYVAIARGYPEATRPRMLALLSTGWVVPGLVGPAISGLMAEALGWRSVFLVLAPMPILAGLLAFPSLRQIAPGIPAADARVRVVGAIALAAGAGLLLAGIGIANPILAIPLALAGLLLAIPAMQRLLPAGTLRAAPGMPAVMATMGLINLAFFGVDAFVPLALVDVRGATIAFAGLALTAGTIAWSAGSWLQARTVARISRRSMERIGLALLSTGIALTVAVLFPGTPMALGPVAWGIAGLGMGLAFITLSLSMLELAPKGQEGSASASLQLMSVLGSGLGTGIGGALIALMQTRGQTVERALLWQYLLMLGAIALAFVAARGLPDTLGRPRPTEDAHHA